MMESLIVMQVTITKACGINPAIFSWPRTNQLLSMLAVGGGENWGES